jgi:mannose-6-phosphate isomerase-like protein (cupin superfamily)
MTAEEELLMDVSVDELLKQRVARFVDRRADWDAFADARVEGFRRAQHRFIGAGASGKHDPHAIPAEHFTLSIMFIPPGQGNAAHTHEVEEVFFVLRGKVLVFFVDAAERRAEAVLGEWDCVSAPANVIHGFENIGLEPAYMQVMLGRATPDLMRYADANLQARRDEHLKTPTATA